MQPGEFDETSRRPDAVLPYQSPTPDPARPQNPGASVGGCLLTALLIPGGIVMALFAAYAGNWPGWVGISVIGVLFAVPLAAGLALRKLPRWHAFAVGLLVGVGIAALVEGICFMSTMR